MQFEVGAGIESTSSACKIPPEFISATLCWLCSGQLHSCLSPWNFQFSILTLSTEQASFQINCGIILKDSAILTGLQCFHFWKQSKTKYRACNIYHNSIAQSTEKGLCNGNNLKWAITAVALTWLCYKAVNSMFINKFLVENGLRRFPRFGQLSHELLMIFLDICKCK